MRTANDIINELEKLGQIDVHVLDKHDTEILLAHIDGLEKEINRLQSDNDSLEIENMNMCNRIESLEDDCM
jgi:hypothetical protein